MPVAQQDGLDVVEFESAAFDIVRQGVPLPGIKEIGFVVMFDEGGKPVFAQKVYPADVVVAENLNGCHIRLLPLFTAPERARFVAQAAVILWL